MHIPKDLVAASAVPLVLGILAESQSYGYAIVKRVAELSDGQLQWTDGMLYPLLHRLEKLDLVSSQWSQSDAGRRRKYYQITPKGRDALMQHQVQWEVVSSALREVWGGGPGPVTGRVPRVPGSGSAGGVGIGRGLAVGSVPGSVAGRSGAGRRHVGDGVGLPGQTNAVTGPHMPGGAGGEADPDGPVGPSVREGAVAPVGPTSGRFPRVSGSSRRPGVVMPQRGGRGQEQTGR